MAIKAKVAVVGLGRIGSAYDAGGASDDAPPRSHVNAVLKNTDLELAAVCDSDLTSLKSFQNARHLPVKTYTSVPDMLAAGDYEIIVIATPPDTHESIALTCLKNASGLRAIFCEKPLGMSAAAAMRVTAAARAAGVALAVNYHRRWDTRIAQLKSEFLSAGEARYANFLFVKEWRNYGAHAIDLMRQLFGPVATVQSNAPGARLRFTSGLNADLTAVDGLDYEIFDLDVLCQSVRLRAVFGGQQILRARPQAGRFVAGYTVPAEETPVVADAPVHGLTHAYAELARFIAGGPAPETSSGKNAVATYRVLEAIEQSAVDGSVVTL